MAIRYLYDSTANLIKWPFQSRQNFLATAAGATAAFATKQFAQSPYHVALLTGLVGLLSLANRTLKIEHRKELQKNDQTLDLLKKTLLEEKQQVERNLKHQITSLQKEKGELERTNSRITQRITALSEENEKLKKEKPEACYIIKLEKEIEELKIKNYELTNKTLFLSEETEAAKSQAASLKDQAEFYYISWQQALSLIRP